MIGVVIPAHNEERLIEQCLLSILNAANHPRLNGRPVLPLVVLDACSDGTKTICDHVGIPVLEVDFKNVGMSRAAGADHLLKMGASWLSFTDADTHVPPDWLIHQIECDADMVCGIVNLDNWDDHDPRVRDHYMSLYQFADDHRHVHGANLGVSARAYQRAGGFQPLCSHEDVRLVSDFEKIGAHIAWTAGHPVITSGRSDFKCREGFGEYLASLAIALCAQPPLLHTS